MQYTCSCFHVHMCACVRRRRHAQALQNVQMARTNSARATQVQTRGSNGTRLRCPVKPTARASIRALRSALVSPTTVEQNAPASKRPRRYTGNMWITGALALWVSKKTPLLELGRISVGSDGRGRALGLDRGGTLGPVRGPVLVGGIGIDPIEKGAPRRLHRLG